MEWPKQLLELFDDPLLEGVRPKVAAQTATDRMATKLAEVNEWIAKHGREPRKDGELKEKMMWAAMTALQKKNLI
jgi:pentose-5-phosphate-3-epimerase